MLNKAYATVARSVKELRAFDKPQLESGEEKEICVFVLLYLFNMTRIIRRIDLTVLWFYNPC